MSQEMREIEARGQDVESAIAAGLAELGVSRSDVIVEIVDEGTRGLLGIGSREAVVRITPMVPVVRAKETAVSQTQPPQPAEPEIDLAGEAETAVAVIQELMDKMEVKVDISSRLSEPDDLTGQQVTIINIEGDDLGILIGPRGETLNAIQYIARLMVGHKLRRRVNLVVDVQGYRQRREQALSRLAERMAKEVAARRRPVSLEPMPPHERRIIHMTLRDDEYVYTQSVGEGKRRKVRILPKSA